jgi:hypothetical protein
MEKIEYPLTQRRLRTGSLVRDDCHGKAHKSLYSPCLWKKDYHQLVNGLGMCGWKQQVDCIEP